MKGNTNRTLDSSHLKQNIMSFETREQLENRIKELEDKNRKLTIQKKVLETAKEFGEGIISEQKTSITSKLRQKYPLAEILSAVDSPKSTFMYWQKNGLKKIRINP